MIKGIDHLVIVVNDLEKAAGDYERMGFTVVAGGRHPVGSHNALIAFSDGSYIEVISFYREALDHRWWEPLQKGERLVDYCVQTDDLTADTQKLRAAGVAINDPVPWSRSRPDGYELKWLLSLATGSHRGVAPFLIQDITPRDERIPREHGHKNGVIGIRKLTIATGEVSTVQHWYKSVLGRDGQQIDDAQLKARGISFKVGPHLLEFLSPSEPQSPLVNWMRMYGPSPYAVVLHTGSARREPLDPELTHGAAIQLTTGS